MSTSRSARRLGESLPGVGLCMGAGVGITIGVAVGGAPGIAVGIVVGAGLGLVGGSIASLWTRYSCESSALRDE